MLQESLRKTWTSNVTNLKQPRIRSSCGTLANLRMDLAQAVGRAIANCGLNLARGNRSALAVHRCVDFAGGCP